MTAQERAQDANGASCGRSPASEGERALWSNQKPIRWHDYPTYPDVVLADIDRPTVDVHLPEVAS